LDQNSGINPTAAKGFANAADSYERGRPEYPAEALEYLIRSLGIGPRSKIMDLGAGTGKFTRLLVSTRAALTAVEPVEEMRKKFASVLPEFVILSGTAESIPAPNLSFDAVVAAQAFHWFASGAALREIHRILKPNGKLGLIWNLRDESLDWVSELTRIVDVHEADVPRYKTGAWKKVFDQTPIFTPLEKRSFKYNQPGNIETVLDLVQSRSYIAALPDQTRETVLKKVVELLKKHPQTKGKDEIMIPYSTDVYWCSKK
jgi:ubiquinone/menaquinone biosynthesis C-methylase UbiE